MPWRQTPNKLVCRAFREQEISSDTTALLSSSRSSRSTIDHSQRSGTEDKADVCAEPNCVITDEECPSTTS